MQQMQNELNTTRAQIARMATEHDSLRQAHEALRSATDLALQARTNEIATAEMKIRQLLFTQKFDLMDMKTLQPETFKGKQSEAFKPWARKVKAFCNAKKAGFRRALEWAETQQTEIQDLTGASWEHADVANEKLHDFLLQLCGDEAQILVDTPALAGRGFEAWRLLTQRYSPCGGQYELDAMIALMQRKPVSNAVQIPGAISKLERDIALYGQRTGKSFPEDWKVPVLLQLLPKAQAEQLKIRYAEGLTNYRTIVENLMTFSQTMRFDGAYGRGDNDMDIGMVDWEDLTVAQTNAYWEAFQRGLAGEEPPPPPEGSDEQFIDALQRKGKGKGKGKRGRQGPLTQAYQGGKADRQPNPATAPPQPGQPDKRICHWCQRMGHVMAGCPDKKAGKPRVAPRRGSGGGCSRQHRQRSSGLG